MISGFRQGVTGRLLGSVNQINYVVGDKAPKTEVIVGVTVTKT